MIRFQPPTLHPRRRKARQKGNALITTVGVMFILSMGAAWYVDYATQTMRESRRSTEDVQVTNVCEAGIQSELRQIWRVLKVDQTFEDIDPIYNGASNTVPKGTVTGQVGPSNGRFASAVIGYTTVDNYTRRILIRAVGWLDTNNNSSVDSGESRKTVDVVAQYSLERSKVFDYTYFVNNYGWMYGFSETTLMVNGDMRANGNFDFTGGSPIVNGSVVASQNSKLDPPAVGVVNQAPVKQTDSAYASAQNGSTGMPERWRQAYNASRHGAYGSAAFETWRDLLFHSAAEVVNGRVFGAVLYDVTGQSAWQRSSGSSSISKTLLDNQASSELVMPDLSDIAKYQALSQTWTDTKQTYQDGTSNPLYGQGAYIDVWDSTKNAYVRQTVNGCASGSLVLVGTSSKPIKIHGPVTVTQDIAIKGYVSGQGTIYTGRNVHVVGSLKYSSPPDERGTNPQTIENSNEKKDILALAARGSVLIGNPNSYDNTNPLSYMTPPFTKGRYDDQGNYIPPYNAKQIDSTGKMRYKSVISDSTMNSIAESVNQIDAIMYTNNVGGGQLGTNGSGGVTINGSLISKDEAMIVYTLPLRMNYDNRIKERQATKQPLINIDLPRSPTLLRSTWQEWGFSKVNASSTSSGGLTTGSGNSLGLPSP